MSLAFDPSDPREIWRFAYGHLRRLRRPYGFAASDHRTGLYGTLFGRDSLWILLFLLKTVPLCDSPRFAEWARAACSDSLARLGRLQGTRVDDAIEEQPGKIIHEFRRKLDDRLRDMGLAFKRGCSYSGFDQTFLFVVAYAQFCKLFPTDPLARTGWEAAKSALAWIERYADDDDDGLFEYRRRNPANLLNQVWKDSFDSIVQTGMDVPPHPIAWVEVQGYGFRALRDGSSLLAERGEHEWAGRLLARANALRRTVEERYWLANEGYHAIALDGTKRPVTMISSNPAHALWTGALDTCHQDALVRRLVQDDLLTPYGVRSVAATSPFYAPFSYHRGAIWPFDNGVIAMGLVERGYQDEANRIARGVSAALARINSPIELYVVLEASIFVEPRMSTDPALVLRRASQENRNHATTATALLYLAAILARSEGVRLPEVD